MGWNILPAGIGNIIGGSLLVVLPFWFSLHRNERRPPIDLPGGRA